MRILICDDHVVFAESLATVLAGQGYGVEAVAHSPDEAITALQDRTVDVCILDVAYGASSTIFDRLTDVQTAAPGTHLILLSANLDPEAVDAGLAAGVRGFVRKDSHVTDIVATLEQVHAGKVVADPPRAKPERLPEPRRQTQWLANFLTPREREVLCHLVRAEDTKTLARALGMSWATARSHIQNILTKMGVHSRLEAVTLAVRYGLVDAQTTEWQLTHG